MVDFQMTVNDLGVTIDSHLSMKDHKQQCVCTTEIDPGLVVSVSGLPQRRI